MIEKTASEIQVRGRADDTIESVISDVATVESQLVSSSFEGRLELVTELTRLQARLKQHRPNASPALKQSAKETLESISHLIEEAKAGSFRLASIPERTRREADAKTRDARDDAPPLQAAFWEVPSLSAVLEKLALMPQDVVVVRVISALEASIEEVLAAAPELRRTLMANIEERLSEEALS
jgi:hypothetical protein